MEELWLNILLITVVMAGLSYGVGMIPILLESSDQNHIIVKFSNGLLFGASVFLAIPESLEIFISTKADPKWVGIIIILGYIIMLNIEQYNSKRETIDIQELEHVQNLNYKQLITSIFQNTLVLTLILHSCFDGIALGSSFHNEDISFLFALVIIIHKLPTCFSLSGLLIDKSIDLKLVRLYIGIFALTTPVISLITWGVLFLIGTNEFIISLLLLFSSGTFLYLLSTISKPETTKEFSIFAIGAIIPLLFSFLQVFG